MQFLEGRIRHYGSDVVLNTEVRAIGTYFFQARRKDSALLSTSERTSKGYLVETSPEKCIVEVLPVFPAPSPLQHYV
jgi:hypothetical protein